MLLKDKSNFAIAKSEYYICEIILKKKSYL